MTADEERVRRLQERIVKRLAPSLLGHPLFYSALLNLVVHLGNIEGHSRDEVLALLRDGPWQR